MTRPLACSFPRLFAVTFLALPLATRAADIAPAAPGSNALKPPARLAEPQVQSASDEPEKQLKKTTIPDGFKTDVWASEPLLGNVVAFSIDEKGNLFTAETYRYRTSVLDIRHYMFMLEDDLASRTTDDRIAYDEEELSERLAATRERDRSHPPHRGHAMATERPTLPRICRRHEHDSRRHQLRRARARR